MARCTKYMAVMMVTTLMPALESVQASMHSMEQSLARLSAANQTAAAGGGAGKGRLPSASLGPALGSCAPLWNLCRSELYDACGHDAVVRRKALRKLMGT